MVGRPTGRPVVEGGSTTLEAGGPVRPVGRLELGHLVLVEVQLQRGHGVGEMVRLGGPTIGADTTRVA